VRDLCSEGPHRVVLLGVINTLLSANTVPDLGGQPNRTTDPGSGPVAVGMTHPDPPPDEEQVEASPVEVTPLDASPVDSDLIDGALRMVVELAHDTVGGADGVSVSLRRHGKLSTVAASNQTVLDMDAQQYATGEGPCVEASIEGRRYLTESLEHEERWPEFTPRARALGINAILSTPLMTRQRPVGALNIYSRTPSAFAARDQKLAAKFAAEASTILTDSGVDLSDNQRSERIQKALRSRELIAQAQGVIMERHGITEHDAYKVLRIYSQRTSRSLRARAQDITDSTVRGGPELGPELGPERGLDFEPELDDELDGSEHRDGRAP
jgi:hypothetical protein